MDPLIIYERLGLALLIGTLLGVERGRRLRDGERAAHAELSQNVAGVRTFALIGLMGGVWGLLSQTLGEVFLGLGFVALAGLVLLSHVLEARKDGNIGITTELAQFLTFGFGVLSARGEMDIAAAGGVATLAFLSFKQPIHQWVDALQEIEVRATVKLLIITVIMLPLLPNHGYGPGATINPYKIWLLVVLISAISFVGYFAIRITGPKIGTSLTALFGGITSSTAVTLSFARMGKENPDMQRLLASGIALASGVMFLRILLIIWVVNPNFDLFMVPTLGGMALASFLGALLLWFDRQGGSGPAVMNIKNPFELATAIKLSIFLTAILALSYLVRDWLGNTGLYALSALSGLADVDAISLSMARLARDPTQWPVARASILIAAMVNTVVKGGFATWLCGQQLALRTWLVIVPSLGLGALVMALF